MQYSKFTVLKDFVRTSKVFSLQFYSYHGILLFLKKQNTFVVKKEIKTTKILRLLQTRLVSSPSAHFYSFFSRLFKVLSSVGGFSCYLRIQGGNRWRYREYRYLCL